MKNSFAIGSVARQLKLVCERVETLTMDIEQFEQGNGDMVDYLVDLRLGELEHAQMLTLKLTELITQESDEGNEVNADGDGSVFVEGELNSVSSVEPETEVTDCVDPE